MEMHLRGAARLRGWTKGGDERGVVVAVGRLRVDLQRAIGGRGGAARPWSRRAAPRVGEVAHTQGAQAAVDGDLVGLA